MAAPESPGVTRGARLPVRRFSYPEVQVLRLQTLCPGRRKCPRMTSLWFAAGAGSAHSHLRQFQSYCLEFGGARENARDEDVGEHKTWGDAAEFRKTKAEGGAITCEGHWVAETGLESEFSCSQGSAVLRHHPAAPRLSTQVYFITCSFSFCGAQTCHFFSYFFHSYLSLQYSVYSLESVLEFPLESNLTVCIKVLFLSSNYIYRKLFLGNIQRVVLSIY